MFLLFLESLGTTELIVIAVAALVLFGPRKLPQLARSLGKSMGEFRRASDDFRRSWETEVEQDESARRARLERAMLPDESPATMNASDAVGATASALSSEAGANDDSLQVRADANSIARGGNLNNDSHADQSIAATEADVATTALRDEMVEPTRKRDWL